MAVAGARQQPALRELGLSVYLPTLLFAIGQGAVIPIVALMARDLGASVALAGFIAALRGVGTLAFDVPSGWMVGRFGEKRAMAAGTIIVAVSLAGAALAGSPLVFAAFTLVMGFGWSVWLLARLTYVSDVMPVHLRGRALASLGGINRLGHFIGPFLGAAATTLVGLDGAYLIHLVMVLAACAVLLAFIRDGDVGALEPMRIDLPRVLRENRSVFLTAGVGTMAIQTVRSTRQVALPLWADHIGLDAGAVSLVFGISLGMELLLFLPAGTAMDRIGRKSMAIPCLVFLSLGMMVLPLTGAFWSITAAGLLMGLGNGLGSGINMTLGADLSPAVGRAQFLGAWRLCGDIGTAGGPLLLSAATAAVTLGGGAVLMGAIGVVGAGVILFRVPETLRTEPRIVAPVRKSRPEV